jgi:hypothetical protein
MLVHAGSCRWKDEYEIERVLECKGPTYARKYKIRWKDYPPTYDSWVPRGNLHPETICEFELANGEYDLGWRHRCPTCDLPCKSKTGVKIHSAKAHKAEPVQIFKGRLADTAVQTNKTAAQQKLRPTICCEAKPLKNVFRFKYVFF